MKKYQVENYRMDEYIKSLNKQRLIKYSIILILVISMQIFIAYNIDNECLFFVIIIIVIFLLLVFLLGIILANNKLKKFSEAEYFLDISMIKFQVSEGILKEFKLDEIAIINKKFGGTWIVKGNKWTKINYIRPKRYSSYTLESENVIFIPSITSNYNELVRLLKQNAVNAIKI